MAAVGNGSVNVRLEKSNYFRSLTAEVSERYKDKIRLINGIDPYCILEEGWSSNGEQLPDMTYLDMVNYFILTKSAYTVDEFKAYKCLEAYNQFAFGWVREVKTTSINSYFVFFGKVLHSQKVSDKPLEPWVIVNKDGCIQSAHCTCMAGLGEACTHIAAVLFHVEYAVRNRSIKTVTESSAYWVKPGVKEVPYARMEDIDFFTPKRKCQALEGISLKKPKETSTYVCPEQTPDEFQAMMKKLAKTGYKSAILSVIEPFAQQFIPTKKTSNDPLILTLLFNQDNCNSSLKDLVVLGQTLDITVTEDQANKIERTTRQQAANKNWFAYRSGRITASKFKAATHVRSATSAPSLVKSICYPAKTKFKNKATEWGCNHEKTARGVYTKNVSSQHDKFNVSDVGFMINTEYPYLGATPDALVVCDCCGKGCLEIKCPYCIKETSIEGSGDKVTCLQLVDGKFQLRLNHAYYYQVQAQMFISRTNYCDFVVWSPNGSPHIERIYPNSEFWSKESKKAKSFFEEAVLPELLGKYFSNLPTKNVPKTSTESDYNEALEVWCICREDRGGKMIMCDTEGCTILWFHMQCLNIKRARKGKWSCTKCKTK